MSFKRGAFIVIEGVDRSGKSTQCKKLVESLGLKGLKAELLTFPDRKTPIGGLISNYLTDKTSTLNDKAIHLLFAANRWEKNEKIKNLLNNGCSVIVDRYSYSGIAYSSIKKDMDVNWCMQPEVGLPKPDLVFLLTLTDEEMASRPGFGEERYENINIQKSVKAIFQKFAECEDNWKVISAAETIDKIHQQLLNDVLIKVKEVETSPIESLKFSKLY